LHQNAPQIVVAEGPAGKPTTLVWQRIEPGHFTASLPLEAGRVVRGAVQAGKFTVPFGPIISGTNPEWTLDRERRNELQAVSQASGGVERVDLSTIWQAPRREEYSDLRPWLIAALLVAFVADTLLTRLGWKVPELRKGRAVRPPKKSEARPKAEAASGPKVQPVEERTPDAVGSIPDTAEARRRRFRQAKR
jgi:hypothetical protein